MAISDKLQELLDIKQDIKEAIENKGVDLTGVEFSGYAEKIDEIQTGGGITDLTGYTWTGNNTLNSSDYSYNVTFRRKGGEVYETFDVSDTYVKYYDTTKVYDDNGSGWVWDGYRTITFTGGDDVSNSSLIAYLEANGTLTPAITDLTGYTWVGNNSLDSFFFDTETEFNINFTSNSNSYTLFKFIAMTIGDPSENEVYYGTTQVMNYGSWTNPAYKEIVISGGVDATNTEFIEWLEDTGTLTAPAPATGGYTLTIEFVGGMYLSNLLVEQANGSEFEVTIGRSCIIKGVTYIKTNYELPWDTDVIGTTEAELNDGKTLTNDVQIIVND